MTIKSQMEVSKKMIPVIVEEDQQYVKVASSFFRKGIKGETITTAIFGEYETEQTIDNDDSYVLCGPTSLEMYVLSGEKFHSSYDSSSAVKIEHNHLPYENLRQRGFQEVFSKRKVLAHKVNKEDMEWFQESKKEACFIAPVRFYAQLVEFVHYDGRRCECSFHFISCSFLFIFQSGEKKCI